jgi:hypothetical protein
MSYRHSAKIGVMNSRKTLHTVYVEPWGDEYSLLPDAEMEIVAYSDEATPWFNIVESEDATQVYCESTADFQAGIK